VFFFVYAPVLFRQKKFDAPFTIFIPVESWSARSIFNTNIKVVCIAKLEKNTKKGTNSRPSR
jgi:hypothetical protein